MKKYTTIMASFALFVGLVFAGANNTFAQQEKGDQEFQINGNLSFNARDVGNTAVGSVGLAYGYFVTQSQQVGIQGIATFSGGNSSLGGEGFYRYNFKTSEKVRPYVGVSVGTFGSTSESSSAVTNNAYIKPNAGVKYYFKRNVAFDLNAGYQARFKDASNGSVDVRMGIAFIF